MPYRALAFAALLPGTAQAQAPATDVAQQRAAIAALDFLDGEWVGDATATTAAGQVKMVQTERIGSLLGGTVKLIEGRGYGASGTTLFNAFAIVSWDTATGRYRIRSYAQGRVTDAGFERTPDGFAWGFPAGPAQLRFHAAVKDGHWQETGTYEMPGRPAVTTTSLDLHRKGATPWPGAGAVVPTS